MEHGIYSAFARVYDDFMALPYGDWAGLIRLLWQKHGFRPHSLLDLACGTGGLMQVFSQRGLDCIGIDKSPEMLAMARLKDRQSEGLYLCQDMRSFELYGTVDAVVCMCNSINYILDDDELVDVFKLVQNYLNPDGMFIFDINTEYLYRDVMADNVFSESMDSGAYIWQNNYFEDDKINQYNLELFIKEQGGLYSRHSELHLQRAYSLAEVKATLAAAKLDFLGAYAEPLELVTDEGRHEKLYICSRKGV